MHCKQKNMQGVITLAAPKPTSANSDLAPARLQGSC